MYLLRVGAEPCVETRKMIERERKFRQIIDKKNISIFSHIPHRQNSNLLTLL